MLKIENLTSGYGKVTIVRNVNIHVEQGEIVSIIGRNGVGKSTLMKTIIGTIKANSGKIIFDNQDVSKLDAHARAHAGFGYAPQGHGIFPKLTVKENLEMGLNINKKAKNLDFNVVYEYFPRLKERLKQRAGTLSGGEQAQLSIGRALIGNPKLLLLDEPSEGVQPNIVKMISDIILQINRDLNLTVLFVEQNISLIEKMTHRFYAMDKGTIVGEHTREELTQERIQKYLSV